MFVTEKNWYCNDALAMGASGSRALALQGHWGPGKALASLQQGFSEAPGAACVSPFLFLFGNDLKLNG